MILKNLATFEHTFKKLFQKWSNPNNNNKKKKNTERA